MARSWKWLAPAALLAAGAFGLYAGELAARQKARPKVEVVFCLDTTGSMGGLIDAAKKKIWAISNQIAAGKPTPDLKVGLVAYRDRGDEYVTKVFDLRPAAIIRDLDLLRPIYSQTAAYGHFGRELPDFTWERTDRVEALKKAVAE